MKQAMTCTGVRKTYPAGIVLDGVTFSVVTGEVAGIVGRSGCGKTTLLRMIAGLTAPDTGMIERVSGPMGYVFQEPRLLPWRTARDNVALPLVAAGRTLAQARKEADRLLGGTGLSGAADHYPAELSGGMAQRVSLARALVVNPVLLLLDEPFAALDIHTKETAFDLIDGYRRAHEVAVLYVSHTPEDVARFSTRLFAVTSEKTLVEIPPMSGADLESYIRES